MFSSNSHCMNLNKIATSKNAKLLANLYYNNICTFSYNLLTPNWQFRGGHSCFISKKHKFLYRSHCINSYEILTTKTVNWWLIHFNLHNHMSTFSYNLLMPHWQHFYVFVWFTSNELISNHHLIKLCHSQAVISVKEKNNLVNRFKLIHRISCVHFHMICLHPTDGVQIQIHTKSSLCLRPIHVKLFLNANAILLSQFKL